MEQMLAGIGWDETNVLLLVILIMMIFFVDERMPKGFLSISVRNIVHSLSDSFFFDFALD